MSDVIPPEMERRNRPKVQAFYSAKPSIIMLSKMENYWTDNLSEHHESAFDIERIIVFLFVDLFDTKTHSILFAEHKMFLEAYCHYI